MDVIGIGALNYDRLMKVKAIAEAGAEVGAESLTGAPGGSAANTIVGLSRLGQRTGFIGNIGEDDEKRFILEDLKREGVNTSAIVTGEGSTGIIFAFIDREGERAMYAYPGVNNNLQIGDSRIEYAKEAKYLHLSSFVGDTSYNEQKKLLKKLKNVNISFAPGMLYAKKNRDELGPILSSTDIIFVNKEETEIFTGLKYADGADELLKMGPKTGVITLGDQGCYVATKDQMRKNRGIPNEGCRHNRCG